MSVDHSKILLLIVVLLVSVHRILIACLGVSVLCTKMDNYVYVQKTLNHLIVVPAKEASLSNLINASLYVTHLPAYMDTVRIKRFVSVYRDLKV